MFVIPEYITNFDFNPPHFDDTTETDDQLASSRLCSLHDIYSQLLPLWYVSVSTNLTFPKEIKWKNILAMQMHEMILCWSLGTVKKLLF